MLRSAEVSAVLVVPDGPFHNLRWASRVEFTLDCFVCERTGRTAVLERGAERGVCSGGGTHGPHHAPARIAAYDHTSEPGRTTLHAVVDFWWAPFEDAADDGRALAPTRAPWVRLHLGYLCPRDHDGGSFSIQTNAVRPVLTRCRHCDAPLAESHEVPRVRLRP
ncbi:hypothetical protein [Pseudonocardia humida]|uniref:Uncharacterized protein n=1 Tax=Pseudonocardia humida TaxID=2800819 RepID=A0ABT1A9Y1_9PSEU|nr:hypothetical protein [Pseudonocardia humida]MCO1659624.1 hypothetical protein [Pseudonocardia humida]